VLKKFLKHRGGNFAIMTSIAIIPIMGGLALGIDYTSMSRQKQITLNALDAAGIATARRVIEGATDAQLNTYAQDFFKANLNGVDPANTTLTVVLPNNNSTGGGTLVLSASLKYQPWFLSSFTSLLGQTATTELTFNATSEVRLKNTLEVALVLDNSGSMDQIGTGSGKSRMTLLKDAAKQLIDTIGGQAAQMKQIDKPVQFGLVPFAGSVNVGSGYKTATWMDTTGISPIHHENFNWSQLSSSAYPTKYAQQVGSAWYARGTGWGTLKDQPLTRFSIFDQMKRVVSVSGSWWSGYTYTYGPIASWGGCVESRPYPYNVNDSTPTVSTPATLFVPMFAPDETDQTDSSSRPANNNWRTDVTSNSSALVRQQFTPKYFDVGTTVTPAYGMDEGPNAGCSTAAIKPLTDVSTAAGVTEVKAAIDTMVANGATNVPEGMAWGWRVLSSGEPFTQGRSDSEKGNDKVVIVLTDGANTYYTPGSVTANSYSGSNWQYGGNDLAGNKSMYSAYGYTVTPYNSGNTRLFQNTSSAVSKTDYSNSNYTKALNEQFATLCANAKAGNLIVMTVSLDLDSTNTTEKTQMDALKACSSDSRTRKDSADPTKPAKLYWNSTGGNLADTFKSIADELSNLRIIG
jgi:Flp pilus assembly protein TadG